jgi:fructose-1,6-bisphosphatase II
MVAIQDRPRHAELVTAVLGVGGAPEGVITACAARLLGGGMQGRLAPQSAAERTRLEADGISVGDVLTLTDLVADDDCVFVATGVTGGTLLGRPQPIGTAWRTFSLLATAGHPSLLVESLTA